MLAYAIKSAIFLSIMYIPYMLILKKESFFHFNRILLVSIMLLSLILPLCDFHSLSIENNPIQHGMIIIGTPTAVMENGGNATMTESFNWFVLIFYLYIIGVIATLIWKIVQLAVLYRTIHNCVLWKDEQDGITIYCHAQDIAPFSWLNTIVISEDDYNNNATEILRHELGHIMHHHSLDIILANIIQTIQWWNPFSWLIASSLCDVHEYEADHAVLTSGVNIYQYQTLLIRKAVANTTYTFANNFNHSLLKRRIAMMVKEKSNPWMRTKALLVVMMATITLCSFSTPELHKQVGIIAEKMQETNEKILRIIKRIEYLQQLRIPEDKIAKIIAKKKERTEKHTVERRETVKSNTEETNKVFDVVDEMPEFPGGIQALIQYLTNTVKYPEESESKGEQGRVICTFVVEADGKVSNTMIAKGVTPALDKEAERVVRSMPNWTPGKLNGQNVRVKYTLPVTFMFQ
jgi:TonB family protein